MRLAAALLCLLGVACQGAEQPQPRPVPPARPTATPTAAAADPTLRWAINEPTSIIPIDAVTPDDLLVVDALYDSLTRLDDELQPQPSVARRWERRAGGRTWRFALRRNDRFSDGSAVTARSFVRTWTALARRGAARHHLRDVVGYRQVIDGSSPRLRGLRAVDRWTLQVRLTRPLSDFPAVVAHPALAPMNTTEPRQFNPERPIGNGPFAMAEPWAHNRFVRLTRAGRLPPTDALGTPVHEVVFSIGDPVSSYIAYEQGGVDVATVPPGGLDDDPPPAEPATRYRGPGLLRGELPTLYLLAFNTRRAPFDDVEARRGVSLALDRDRLIDDAFDGNAAPAWSLAPPAIPGGRRRTCMDCTYDPGQARRLLGRARVRDVTLWIDNGGEHEAVADGIRRDLGAAGVRVHIRAVSFRRLTQALRRGEPGLFRFGWTVDYPTLDNALRPLFHSTATPARGGANYARYRRADVDRLLDRAAGAASNADRITQYRRAEDLLARRDLPMIPIAVLQRRTVVAERVHNLTYGPMGTVDLLRVRIAERAG